MKFDLTPMQAVKELESRLDAGETREVAHFIVWYVEDLKGLRRLDELNDFIGLVDPGVDTHASAAILRSSYTHGELLTNWKPFLDAVREAHQDNPRIDRILVGLNKPYIPSCFY